MERMESTDSLSKPRSRRVAPLEASTEKKLVCYAALAGASGLGVLAMIQPSDAEVIYTPTHQVVPHHSTLNLDLNDDGVNDFTFHSSSVLGFDGTFARLSFQALAKGNGAISYSSLMPVLALKPGDPVGAAARFNAGVMAFVYGTHGTSGNFSRNYVGAWAPGEKNQYIGIRFVVDGKVHYGWARMTVEAKPARFGGITAVLTGYAYETEPNRPIVTGRTSGTEDSEDSVTLGKLATGAVSKH